MFSQRLLKLLPYPLKTDGISESNFQKYSFKLKAFWNNFLVLIWVLIYKIIVAILLLTLFKIFKLLFSHLDRAERWQICKSNLHFFYL